LKGRDAERASRGKAAGLRRLRLLRADLTLPRRARVPATPPGGELAPAEKKLLTQQGGVLVFDGCELLYK
jgi:hypothetical protein